MGLSLHFYRKVGGVLLAATKSSGSRLERSWLRARARFRPSARRRSRSSVRFSSGVIGRRARQGDRDLRSRTFHPERRREALSPGPECFYVRLEVPWPTSPEAVRPT